MSMYHLVGFVSCFESIIVVMSVLPNVFVSLIFILQLHLMSSAPIENKASSTGIQPFYPIDSLGSHLPANDDVDDALETNDDEGKNKAVDITEEEEIADDKEISEIAEEDAKGEVNTIEIGKMEEKKFNSNF